MTQPTSPEISMSLTDLSGAYGPNTPPAVGRKPRLFARFGKRLMDLALVCLALPVAGPLVLVLAVLIRLQGGPAVYGHPRIGRGGRPFTCWKLRTMVPDAQGRLTRLLQTDPEAAREWRLYQKLRRDPRVTRLGHVLRRSCLDELPQLWNILRGEMSFVGPRPVTADELDRYGVDRAAYLSLRPGLTGAWQVSRCPTSSYAERVACDRSYARSVSFGRDLSILLRTFAAVFYGTGI